MNPHQQQPPPPVPRPGGVRCYWALLAPRWPSEAIPGSKLELVFVHMDPVLSVHLARQRMSLMGRGIIEFIHPHEREQARQDLSSAIASNDLQGSVTRMRFARLSRIRVLLGCTPEENHIIPDADTFVEDEEYLILDLVLNWVADGLLLAFFHAIKDKDPVDNNDPSKKAEEWTNFCGTGNMPEDQIDGIHQNISANIPLPPPSRYPPTRIFQLHTTSTSPTRPASLIFTWPPTTRSSTSPPSPQPLRDGSYDAQEYTDLMKGVDMNPAQHHASGNSEMRTNCTTRYGATHGINSEGLYRHVMSVFIPYGSLIFACFQTVKQVDLGPRLSGVGQVGNVQGSGHVQERRASVSHRSSAQQEPPQQVVPAQRENDQPYHYAPQLPQPTTTPTNTAYGLLTPAPSSASAPESWQHPAHLESNRSDPPYPPQQRLKHPIQMTPAEQWQRPPVPSLVPSPEADHAYQPLSTPYAPIQHQHHHHRSHSHHTPLPQHHPYPQPYRHSPQTPHEQTQMYAQTFPTATPAQAYPSQPYTPQSPDNPGKSGLRPVIPPPVGVEKCRACGIIESPEWRRSESGIKDLCNACGLRLARQVAKREGRQKPRKKKEKERSSEE